MHVTEADLAIGGSYSPAEKQALIAACNGRNVAKREDTCTCIADRAGTELSRFLRLVLTATLEGSATKIVAITKGLLDSGVPEEKIEGGREAVGAALQGSDACLRAEPMSTDAPGAARALSTTCCIVGGGPAGMMLGLLLARAGIDVVVLEKHADFLRDFRGDTIHPSTLEVMDELGLLDDL